MSPALSGHGPTMTAHEDGPGDGSTLTFLPGSAHTSESNPFLHPTLTHVQAEGPCGHQHPTDAAAAPQVAQGASGIPGTPPADPALTARHSPHENSIRFHRNVLSCVPASRPSPETTDMLPPEAEKRAAAILSVCLRNSRHGLPSICISGHEQKTENHNAVTTRQVCHPKSSPCPRGVTKPHTDPRAEAAEKGHSELVQAGQHRFAAALKMSPEVPTQEGPPRSSQRRGSPGLGDPAVWQ